MTNYEIQISKESENPRIRKYDLPDRAAAFAIRASKFIQKLAKNQSSSEYSKQLIRSSSSVGANLEEADGTLSKRDFVNKMAISRREARESKYWLRLIEGVGLVTTKDGVDELKWLQKEAHELLLILSSIINKFREPK